jgi:hypothetical protein
VLLLQGVEATCQVSDLTLPSPTQHTHVSLWLSNDPPPITVPICLLLGLLLHDPPAELTVGPAVPVLPSCPLLCCSPR